MTAVNDARPSMKDNWFGFELGGEYSMLEITTKRKKCRTVDREQFVESRKSDVSACKNESKLTYQGLKPTQSPSTHNGCRLQLLVNLAVVLSIE